MPQPVEGPAADAGQDQAEHYGDPGEPGPLDAAARHHGTHCGGAIVGVPGGTDGYRLQGEQLQNHADRQARGRVAHQPSGNGANHDRPGDHDLRQANEVEPH